MSVLQPPGGALALASWIGTLALVVATPVAVVWHETLPLLSIAVAMPMFLGGSVAMLVAFAAAVERSRRDAIGMGGLYLLAGTAPDAVTRSFRWSLLLQVLVGLAGAIARPYTPVAFGILASMWGLGFAGIWGARHGHFEARHARPSGASGQGTDEET